MHWKLKAAIQNGVSLLPSTISYASYYWIQRHFGGLKHMNPVNTFSRAITAWTLIREAGCDPRGKIFFEVGTGRAPIAPIAYWLMGAKKTITVDVNPYLKPELTKECVQFIADNTAEIRTLFTSTLDENRMDDLLHLNRSASFSAGAVLELCGIEYIAPGDAGRTAFPPRSIDFHTSILVFQHIPPGVLTKIIDEGNRLINKNGVFVHRINYTDHFSHSDKTISALNFLRFSDDEWERYAGNRYMYMNRLRHDDYIHLFQSSGHRIAAEYPDVDQHLHDLLQHGSLQLNERFKGKSIEVLSMTGAWIVSQRRESQSTAGL